MQNLHVQMDNKGHLQNEFATSIKTAHETFVCKVFFLLNGYVFTQIWKFKKKIATFFSRSAKLVWPGRSTCLNGPGYVLIQGSQTVFRQALGLFEALAKRKYWWYHCPDAGCIIEKAFWRSLFSYILKKSNYYTKQKPLRRL